MEKDRITKLAFAIVFVSFVLSTIVSLWSLQDMARRNMRELGIEMAARIHDTILGELAEPVVAAKTMANDNFLIERLKEESLYGEQESVDSMSAYLRRMKEGLDYETAFVISEESKRYYTFDGLLKVIQPGVDGRDDWYPDFLSLGQDYDLVVDNDEMSQDAWTVFVNAQIEDEEGELVGVCGIGVHMTKSQDLFYGLEQGYQVRISLADPEGLVQVSTNEEEIQSLVLSGIPPHTEVGDDYVFQQISATKFLVTRYVDKLGWYLVVESEDNEAWNQCVNVILLNIALCLFVMIVLVISTRIIILRTNALTHASFRDSATQLYNRRAFEEEKARFQTEPMGEDFVYLTADVNGLKTVNDTLGHSAGDELIKGAATCLKACFGKYGKIFRIGGDEFAAMLNVTEEELDGLKESFQKDVAAWRGEKVSELAVSCGYASHREFPSESISELSRISDERMYATKAEYYRRTGKDRRKH